MAPKDSILIVDDEPKLARSLSLILQHADYVVTTAPDAATALQVLHGGAYDLVYLDIRLPDQSGIKLLPQIHTLYPDMPVVILTAHASLETAIEAVRAGAGDYLLKPIDPETILARTKKILEEQTGPKRKRAIASHIQLLLSELQATDGRQTAPSGSDLPPSSLDAARYLKRGSVQVDLHTHQVTINNQIIVLAALHFRLPGYLNAGIRQTRSIMKRWSKSSQGYQEISLMEAREMTRWQVHELRKELEQDLHHPQIIITVRDVGYRLVA